MKREYLNVTFKDRVRIPKSGSLQGAVMSSPTLRLVRVTEHGRDDLTFEGADATEDRYEIPWSSVLFAKPAPSTATAPDGPTEYAKRPPGRPRKNAA